MISHFEVSEDRKKVSWKHDGKPITFEFDYPVSAHHIEHLDEALAHFSTKEDGATNLAIYNADGTLKARPPMPMSKHEVRGWTPCGSSKDRSR
jgi:hypothetical protein